MASRLEKLELMLAEDPQDQMLRYMLALELQQDEQQERRLELLNGLMADQTPYVPAFLMAGQQLAGSGRVEDARATYTIGIEQAKQQLNEHAAGEMAKFRADLDA